MSRLGLASRVSERVYRVLLVAYPREFRREYGSRMQQAFGDLCREELRKGEATGFVRMWVRTILDLGTTAFVHRTSDLGRSNGKEVGLNDRRLAGLGFVLLLAPLLFVSASLMKYELGIGFLFDPLEAFLSEPGRRYVFNLISPVVFLGGLSVALALNAYAVLRLRVVREDGSILGTVKLEARLLNIAVAGGSLLLLVTLLGYFFAENFVYRP